MNDEETLYKLLPSFYRIRDKESGEPFRALLQVIENEMVLLKRDIDGLYNNMFIETCNEWAVPYIGDLLGVRGIHPAIPGVFSLRPFIANTLRYRRRKGTVAVIEQVARDITGWPSRAIEYFHLLSITQNMNHILPDSTTIDFRDTDGLELIDSSFEKAAHTADIRRISGDKSRYNIPNIGIFLWRLQSYRLDKVTASVETGSSDPVCYLFNPLGLKAPLFNNLEEENNISHIAGEADTPGKLRRLPLQQELKSRRCDIHLNKDFVCKYFGKYTDSDNVNSVFEVYLDDELVKPEEMVICNLIDSNKSRWAGLPKDINFLCKNEDGTAVEINRTIKVAVDPVRGRVAVPGSVKPGTVKVSYAYGFSGDLGGGPYDRSEYVDNAWRDPSVQHFGVTLEKNKPDEAGEVTFFDSVSRAVDAWSNNLAGSKGVISILDNATYAENGDKLEIDLKGRELLIIAAGWPEEDDPDKPGTKIHKPAKFNASERRPYLKFGISVKDTGDENANPGKLYLNGLLLKGPIEVKTPGSISMLDITHCTIVPWKNGTLESSINVDNQIVNSPESKIKSRLAIYLSRSICGTIICPSSVNGSEQTSIVSELSMTDCIIDSSKNTGAVAIDAYNTLVSTNECTIFGTTQAGVITASNCIFSGLVTAKRRQKGCIRYSYVPSSSTTPKRFRCQPDLAISKRLKELNSASGPAQISSLPVKEEKRIMDIVVPVFTSSILGEPGYGQLSRVCPDEIFKGVESGVEMGAFNFLKQAHRLANLRAMLDEYMRFGLEAGIFFVD
jgi:hypothetical protein